MQFVFVLFCYLFVCFVLFCSFILIKLLILFIYLFIALSDSQIYLRNELIARLKLIMLNLFDSAKVLFITIIL